jgi:peptidoglycan hydrolase CwlO-like protein
MTNKMASKQVTHSLFKPDVEAVLTRGLNAMTKACDSLSKQNEELIKDIEGLKRKIERLQERILENPVDKE